MSQKEWFKRGCSDSLKHADEILLLLQGMSLVQGNDDIAAQVAYIAEDMTRFKGYQETILFLAANPLDNIPATKFTTEKNYEGLK